MFELVMPLAEAFEVEDAGGSAVLPVVSMVEVTELCSPSAVAESAAPITRFHVIL